MVPTQVQHTVAAAEASLPLSALAEALLPGLGAQLVARGGAWLDGRRLPDPAAPAAAGAVISLRLPPGGVYAELELGPADIAYEDEWLLALHKAAGWYVGATPWDVIGNALAAAGRYLASRDGAAPPLHLAHQLDRDTSGLLLLSKSPRANGPLAAAFAGGAARKQYLALCAGLPPAAGQIHTGHGRAAGGRWRVYPLEDVGRALPAGGGHIKEARTGYALLAALDGAALLGATPHTGRTHQIRLHLAHIGHPLLGDGRYGGPASHAGLELPGHLLHAASLELAHPLTGAPLELSSPPPPLFASLAKIG